VLALRIVSETGALLNGHCDVRADHGLKVGKTADSRPVIPQLGTRLSVWIVVQDFVFGSGGTVKLNLTLFVTQTHNFEDLLYHPWLGKLKRAIATLLKSDA
jgi:hypothetical protein